jgi:inosine/xanthosine triphosphatase
MASLVIAVGTTRKPKLAAVYEAISQVKDVLAAGTPIEVIGVEVESGVSHTPTSREELMRGARRRAESLQDLAKRRNEPWNFFVGLEGGLEVIRENGERRVFLESWVYVSDGTHGHFGRSGAVELPPSLAEEVLGGGTELSEAIDQFAGAVGIRDAQGAWGVLTANKISRQESFRVALITALAPFYNRTTYGKTAVAIQS